MVQDHVWGTLAASLVAKPWGHQKMLIRSTGVALTVFKLLCKYWL